MLDQIAYAGMFYVPFLFSLCVHEFAHGWVANKLGDPTAKLMGRLTLSPVAHADVIGTVILPLLAILTKSHIFFGWAKPVPVNPRNLKNERTGMFWVALAGPVSNLIMALIAAFVLVYFDSRMLLDKNPVAEMAKVFFGVNISLAVFNLIPINPLDGGKIIARFLPESINRSMEDHQMTLNFILMFLFLSGSLSIILMPVFSFFYSTMLKIALLVLGVAH